MMKQAALVLLLVAVVASQKPRTRPAIKIDPLPSPPQHSQRWIVDYINRLNTTWKAAVNPMFEGATPVQIQHYMGVPLDEERRKVKQLTQREYANVGAIPDSFDGRDAWPECADVIGNIRDQSACGSCWAVAAAGAMSDRICISSQGATQVSISAKDLLSCCLLCGNGCDGGFPTEAWTYAQSTGIVSGGPYGDTNTCQPYPFAKCEHHNNATTYPPCPSRTYNTPSCAKTCIQQYNAATYQQDKHKCWAPTHEACTKKTNTKSTYAVQHVSNIQTEIMTYGSVEMSFSVYEDFLSYTSGVYVHKTGKYDGGHAVRGIGWGVEDGTPYWLIANSWNEDWGDKGYFKILRGQDECGIESGVVAGQW